MRLNWESESENTLHRGGRQSSVVEHWPTMLNLVFSLPHILTKIGKTFMGLYKFD